MAPQTLRAALDIRGAQISRTAKSRWRRLLDQIMAAQMRRAEREIAAYARLRDLTHQSSLSHGQIKADSKSASAGTGIVRPRQQEFVT